MTTRGLWAVALAALVVRQLEEVLRTDRFEPVEAIAMALTMCIVALPFALLASAFPSTARTFGGRFRRFLPMAVVGSVCLFIFLISILPADARPVRW
jgi:hypothetical protein